MFCGQPSGGGISFCRYVVISSAKNLLRTGVACALFASTARAAVPDVSSSSNAPPSASPAGAWSASPGPISDELRSLHASDLKDDALSPFQTRAGIILGGGLALSGAALWYENRSHESLQNWMKAHRPLGAASKIGDAMGQLIPNALYTGGMIIDSVVEGPGEAGAVAANRARIMVEGTLWAAVFSTALKVSVSEMRPDHSTRDSFPSGHATTAFAFASVVGFEHPWYWGVASYGLATFVAVSRLNDNRHYLHDVIAGAAIGTSFGVGVWLAEKQRKSKSGQVLQRFASHVSIAPEDSGGLAVTTHFEF